jgi:hypothetical protein
MNEIGPGDYVRIGGRGPYNVYQTTVDLIRVVVPTAGLVTVPRDWCEKAPSPRLRATVANLVEDCDGAYWATAGDILRHTADWLDDNEHISAADLLRTELDK